MKVEKPYWVFTSGNMQTKTEFPLEEAASVIHNTGTTGIHIPQCKPANTVDTRLSKLYSLHLGKLIKTLCDISPWMYTSVYLKFRFINLQDLKYQVDIYESTLMCAGWV